MYFSDAVTSHMWSHRITTSLSVAEVVITVTVVLGINAGVLGRDWGTTVRGKWSLVPL